MQNQPNILFIQTDQLTANALSFYGDPVCQTPALDKLAQEGVVFETAYCNFPLCGPSRASMMTGLLASKTGVFDNASEFAATLPTYAHYLRDVGYQTCLVGKMHFIGPDQLHGFEERLTSDIYPADFSWAANWANESGRDTNDSRAVTVAGPATRTVQLDYDDEVTYKAVQKLYHLAQSDDNRPFFLQVSFTHPHEPYLCTREHWDRYEGVEIPMPVVGPRSAEEHDPHSARILAQFDLLDKTFDDDDIVRAKRGYYGSVSYIDDKVGELMTVLEATGMLENTVIIFTSDHGDMLGERGMWFKKTFFEHSMRIPLLIYAPKFFKPQQVTEFSSLVDLLPTFLSIATDGTWQSTIEPLDGADLTAYLDKESEYPTRPIYAEYLSETTPAPIFMIRRGPYKFVYCAADPDQLYDVVTDPHELNNLAQDESFREIVTAFHNEIDEFWDEDGLTAEIKLSQQRRQLVHRAMKTGNPTSWDYAANSDNDALWYRGKEGYNEWAFKHI
ncbi:MAG: choline-sulfatase [Chloroflexota bacterium]